MSESAITCRYVYDGKQFGRATPTRWKQLAFWVFILSALVAWRNRTFDAPVEISPQAILLDVLPAISCFSILLIWTLIFRRLAVRHTAVFKKELCYTLDENGVHLKSSIANSDLPWSLYLRATERSYGFTLIQQDSRVFNWLPKDGFDNPESIARCRELLRHKIPKTKLQPA